jgi:hypothetical protein
MEGTGYDGIRQQSSACFYDKIYDSKFALQCFAYVDSYVM